jgi:dynactin-6
MAMSVSHPYEPTRARNALRPATDTSGRPPCSKDAFEFSSRAVVCQDTDIRGAVTIGPGTIVHPKATIFAVNGPIRIGSCNIIEEQAVIVNRQREPLMIGDLNLLAVASRIEASSVGDFNTFGPKSSVPATMRITNCCSLGAGVALLPAVDADLALAGDSDPADRTDPEKEPSETLEPYTALWLSDDGQAIGGARIVKRRVWDGKGEEAERDLRMKQVMYLKDVRPTCTPVGPLGAR